MKRVRFTEEQIIGVLREQEAGAKGADLCRKYGMSEATLYNWKAKYGGLDVSEAKRLRALEDENAKLKRLLADAMLDEGGAEDVLEVEQQRRACHGLLSQAEAQHKVGDEGRLAYTRYVGGAPGAAVDPR